MTTRRCILKSLALAGPFFNFGRFPVFGSMGASFSAATIELVRESNVLDMLGLVTLDFRQLSVWQREPSSLQPEQVSRLRSSGTTVFHPAVGYTSGDIHKQSLTDIRGWNRLMDAHPESLLRIESGEDFRRAKEHGAVGIIIGQQNSSHFRCEDDVDLFYCLGQRASQLTYDTNRIGGGCSDPRNPGLTDYGERVIARMNRAGMAIDVSHCSDRTTLEAIDASVEPVVVTHSNCRALVPGSARCKTDEAIRKLAAKDGVMGVTMIRPFVRSTGDVTIADVLSHVDRIVRLTGVEHAGIGTDVDLDGRERHQTVKRFDLSGIEYQNKIFYLAEGLLKRGYNKTDAALILGGNFERVLSRVWAARSVAPSQ